MDSEEDVRRGVSWVIETLRDRRSMRGWQAKAIDRDREIAGLVHVDLTDRYGRVYRFDVKIMPRTYV